MNLHHWLPVILHLRGRAELAAGSGDAAYGTFLEALAAADEMGIHCEIWALCWKLANLEIARGEKQRGEQLKARARAEIGTIAAHAGTDALREAFLARTDVRRILA